MATPDCRQQNNSEPLVTVCSVVWIDCTFNDSSN